SEAGAYMGGLAGGGTPVQLVYPGVDTGREPAPPPENETPVILAVGRLVEKKGYKTLFRAAAILSERGVAFRLRVGGEGPEWSSLQRLVHELGLSDKITFLGPLNEAEVRAEYARADVFSLACRQLENGDRDG